MSSTVWSEMLVILCLDCLVAFLCILGFFFVILPYLLKNSKGATIRTALRTWTFEPSDMDQECTPQQRLAAKLYIEYLNLLCQLNGLMLIGTCTLAPVNWYFGTVFDSDDGFFERTSSLNIAQEEDILWVHAGHTWLLSIVAIALVVRARRKVRAWACHFDFGAADVTLVVKGLPVQLVDPVKIHDALFQQLPKVAAVHVAYELSEMLELTHKLQQLDSCRAQCARAKELEFQPRVCCRKVDLGDRMVLMAEWRAQLEEQITELQEQPLRGTGYAYVTFSDRDAAKEALAHGTVEQTLKLTGLWGDQFQTSYASEPEAIVWNSLRYGFVRRTSQALCGNVLLITAIVLIFSTTALLDALSSLVSELPAAWRLTVTNSIPSLVTMISAWLLVPLLLTMVAEMTPFDRHDTYAIWYLRRYYVYLLVAIVIVTTTAMSVAALCKAWVESGDTESTFSSVFNTQYTIYFIKYSINFALLSSPLELLQYPELITAWLEGCIACCARQCCSNLARKNNILGTGIPSVALFQYPFQYVVVLHVVSIGLLYCSILPMISPFTFLYLLVKRKVDCFNLLLQPRISIAALSGAYVGSADVALQALNLLVITIIIYQLGMMSFFVRHQRTDLSMITVAVCGLTTCSYFSGIACNKWFCSKIPCLDRAVNRFRYLLDGTLRIPAASGLRQMHMSLEEYEHPALQAYLGPARTLIEALTTGAVMPVLDEDGEELHKYTGLVGHVTPNDTPSSRDVLEDVELSQLGECDAKGQSGYRDSANNWVVDNLDFLSQDQASKSAVDDEHSAL